MCTDPPEHKLIEHRCFTHPQTPSCFPKQGTKVGSNIAGNADYCSCCHALDSNGSVPTAAASLLTPLAHQTLTGNIPLCNRSPSTALPSIPVCTLKGEFIQVGMTVCREAGFCLFLKYGNDGIAKQGPFRE